jgi:hypothetical protein
MLRFYSGRRDNECAGAPPEFIAANTVNRILVVST